MTTKRAKRGRPRKVVAVEHVPVVEEVKVSHSGGVKIVGREAVEYTKELKENVKNAKEVILGKKTYESIRYEPEYGDNGTFQNLFNLRISVSEDDYGVKVK